MTASVLLLLLLSIVPTAAGDGMPAYRIADVNDPDGDVFSSTFESRQLARIDLMNDTHERIRLFLSVYSLDPGKNLTIMVPMRTLPVDVSGKPMMESEFRKEYLLERIETEIIEQDPEVARAKLWDETSSAIRMTFGSMLLTFPGEYSEQNFRLVDDGSKGEDTGLGGNAVIDTVEPIQQYEFDGFSIDVFGVDSAGILDDYLVDRGLAIPESDALDRYRGQYVAVIEAESKPPIDPGVFSLCTDYAPNATANLTEFIGKNPRLPWYEQEDLLWDVVDEMQQEIYPLDLDRHTERDIEDAYEDLIDAVYGNTDFEGEVLTVDLPLDGGKMFFPLGTSTGWPTRVGDIDILFRVPEGNDLDIPDTEDAYLYGHHWYLFRMELANPGFDLESHVMEGNEDRRVEAERADWMYGNSTTLAYLTALAIALVLWAGFAHFLRRGLGIDGAIVRDPLLWGMLGLSFLISIPGALLVYLMLWPIKRDMIAKRLAVITPIAMYPAAAVMLVLGVLL